jgi:hypothetical protein
MKTGVVLLAAMMLSTSTVAHAHHNASKVYAIAETAKIEGKVVRFLFRNPHSYLLLREAGHGERVWSLEWASAKKLGREGLRADTIRVDDYLAVVGHPPRKAGEYRILVQSIKRRTDNFSWGEVAGETVD